MVGPPFCICRMAFFIGGEVDIETERLDIYDNIMDVYFKLVGFLL